MHVILILLNMLNSDSFVIKTCFTENIQESDISMSLTKNIKEGNYCGFLETSCKNAEMIVFIDSNSKNKLYLSKEKNICK